MKELLCEYFRAGRPESVHRVSLVAMEEGRPVLVRGEVDSPVFMRSCAKPFQVMPFLEAGGIVLRAVLGSGRPPG